MNKSAKILAFIKRKNRSTDEIQKEFNISRQMVHKYLKPHIESGLISKSGRTKGAVYTCGDIQQERTRFSKVFPVKGADTDAILEEIDMKTGISRRCNEKSGRAISGCLKNLIDNVVFHSGSELMMLNLKINHYNVEFKIEDSGTGIFSSLKKRYGLNDESDVLLLIKRAARGARDEALGRGVADCMNNAKSLDIRSGKQRFLYEKPDTFSAEDISLIKGTSITVIFSRNMK